MGWNLHTSHTIFGGGPLTTSFYIPINEQRVVGVESVLHPMIPAAPHWMVVCHLQTLCTLTGCGELNILFIFPLMSRGGGVDSIFPQMVHGCTTLLSIVGMVVCHLQTSSTLTGCEELNILFIFPLMSKGGGC